MDLRVSVTDRCNFRCRYCMPEDITFLPRSEILTFEEIERVAKVMVGCFGIESLRLTGGEPTVRAELPALVERLAQLPVELSMTTNGSALSRLAKSLKLAGLQRVTVSLDTLRRDRFAQIAGRDLLPQVLAGIEAALEAGLHPVKVNSVLMRGLNDDEVIDLATFGRDLGVELRFIEFMPLDGAGEWSSDRVVPAAEILAKVSSVFPLEPLAAGGPEPAERYRYSDGGGTLGVVASVTRPFCASCDRARLSADGQLRSCLFALRERDLRSMLRSGASDEELAQAIEDEVASKWAGHSIGKVSFVRPARSMSQIGG
jgi:cyclic pyranopterin phosphate synthase